MAFGKTLDYYQDQKYKIEDILLKLEKETVEIHNVSYIFDFHNILFDIENMTEDDYLELYPYDNPESIHKEYQKLLKDFRNLLDRYLIWGYRQGLGGINIILSESYEFKGEVVPTLELLNYLPLDFYLEDSTPEENFRDALNPYNEHGCKLSLFVAARAGYEPAKKLAKEKYGWEF